MDTQFVYIVKYVRWYLGEPSEQQITNAYRSLLAAKRRASYILYLTDENSIYQYSDVWIEKCPLDGEVVATLKKDNNIVVKSVKGMKNA
jgi:hypothetical protein